MGNLYDEDDSEPGKPSTGFASAASWTQVLIYIASGFVAGIFFNHMDGPATDQCPQLPVCDCGADASKVVSNAPSANADGFDWKDGATLILVVLIIIRLLLPTWQFLLAGRTAVKRIKDCNKAKNVQLDGWIKYQIEIWFTNHSETKPAFLLFATAALVLTGSVVYFFASEEHFGESLWKAWTFVADPGSHADESHVSSRLIALVITIGGMLIFALMIGLITEEISEQVDSLRKGKSDVLEVGHTVILGWGHKIIPLIQELCAANESDAEERGVIVILAEQDKEDMETQLSDCVGDTLGSRIICRQGNPILLNDLRKVSVSLARSIILLSADNEGADENDARILRILLSLMTLQGTLRKDIIMVAELCDIDNSMHIGVVGGPQCQVVVAHDIVGRAMVQSACIPQLAPVYDAILGFAGSEFYIEEWPTLEGRTFREVLLVFEDAVPCGIKRGRTMMLNPLDSEVVCEGDEILVLSEDDDTYKPRDLKSSFYKKKFNTKLPKYERQAEPPVCILFLGWRRDIGDMILQLSELVEDGSELTMVNAVEIHERERQFEWQGRDLKQGIPEGRLKINHIHGDIRNRGHLEKLDLSSFKSILILSEATLDEGEGGPSKSAGGFFMDSDANTLATMLLVRDIQTRGKKEQHAVDHSIGEDEAWLQDCRSMHMHSSDGRTGSHVICEILDSRTKSLTTVAQVSHYIMSHELVSRYLAMVSERAEVNAVLSELFRAEGNEIHVRNVSLLAGPQEQLSYWDIMLRARELPDGEIVLGYLKAQQQGLLLQRTTSGADKDESLPSQIVLNPPNKGNKQCWSRVVDSWITIAED